MHILPLAYLLFISVKNVVSESLAFQSLVSDIVDEYTDSPISDPGSTEIAINILPQDASLCENIPSEDSKIKITTCKVDQGYDVYRCTGSPNYICQRETPDGNTFLYYQICPKDQPCQLCLRLRSQGEKNCGRIPKNVDLFP